MGIPYSESSRLVSIMTDPESWKKPDLHTKILSAFKRAIHRNIELLAQKYGLLVYNVSLSASNDNEFKEVLFFLLHQQFQKNKAALYDYIDSLRLILLRKKLAFQPHFFFLFGQNAKLTEMILDTFKNCSVLRGEDLARILADKNSSASLVRQIREKVLVITSPFHHLGPCNPDLFVGRSDLIAEIMEGEKKAYAITGGRRIGKSSLLFKILSEIGNEDKYSRKYIPAYYDCSNFSSFSDLIDQMAREFFPKNFYQNEKISWAYDYTIRRIGQLKGKKLFLLLDEIDPIIKDESDMSMIEFFNAARGEANKGTLRIIIAGFRGTFGMINDKAHPFFNLCGKTTLGALEKSEVHELVATPFLQMGIELKNKEAVITEIYNQTLGHPSVVQFLAKQLFQNRSNKEISVENVKAVMDTDDTLEFILDTFVLNTSPLEKFICLSNIDKDSFSNGDVHAELENHNFRIPDETKAVHTALQSLKMNSILASEKNNHRFLYPLMRKTLKIYYYFPGILEVIKRDFQNEI